MNLFDEYRWRGMLQDATEGADEALAAAPLTAYIGFDPTAASLHVGTLVPIMGLVHAQRAGHHPIILCGGGTGLIPPGKATSESSSRRRSPRQTSRESVPSSSTSSTSRPR